MVDTSKVTRFEVIDHTLCSSCGGDGIQRCSNPDHGLIDALGGDTGRLGCPLCGHDPQYRIKGESCETCSGGGMQGRTIIAMRDNLRLTIQLQDDDRTLKVFINERHNI